MIVEVNYLSVLVAGIASMILGAIWYSPKFAIGKQWMKLSGIKQFKGKDAVKNMGKSYFAGFISIIVSALMLSLFVDYFGATTPLTGLLVGFMAWLGFVATTTLGNVIYEGKPMKLYLLNNAYNLMSYIIMGSILAAW